MRSSANILIIALATFCTISCSMTDESGKHSSSTIVNVGDPLPTFAVHINDGSLLTTSSLKGKPSLIVFFNTSCPDCRHHLPSLNKRYLLHNNDTTFVAISREEDEASVSAYWAANEFSLPYSAQTDRSVYSLFAKQGIPLTFISDANGIIVEMGY